VDERELVTSTVGLVAAAPLERVTRVDADLLIPAVFAASMLLVVVLLVVLALPVVRLRRRERSEEESTPGTAEEP
jgi:flagellar biosynthesis/type III secretory pathway M-ring protein FliF/YscJ